MLSVCETCSLGFILIKLDSTVPIYNIKNNEMKNVTQGMFVNYTQPGDPHEYWNDLIAESVLSLQSVFAVTTEMKSKYFFLQILAN